MAGDYDFTDPFTGEVLDDPVDKSYRVKYSVREMGKQSTVIDTLAKKRLTKAQAKEKLAGRPAMMMTSKSDITVHSISKID